MNKPRKETIFLKTINNDYVLDTVYDLADEAGMKINDFLELLHEQFGVPEASLEGLPQEIVAELEQARLDKKEKRKTDRQSKEAERINGEIKKFRELFPDVEPESIPDEVWSEVSNGISLPHAYALWAVTESSLDSYAKGINKRNSDSGAVLANDGDTEPVYTREAVEKMTNSDVKKNYKSILKAMKNWRF